MFAAADGMCNGYLGVAANNADYFFSIPVRNSDFAADLADLEQGYPPPRALGCLVRALESYYHLYHKLKSNVFY